MDLFRCEQYHADLTARACLTNQGLGKAGGERYLGCLDCEIGRMLRETSGLEVPVVRVNPTSNWVPAEVAGSQLTTQARVQRMQKRPEKPVKRKDDMGKHAAKERGEAVTLTASTPAAVARVAESLTSTPAKPCKHHPDREALPGENLCRECLRAYQREKYHQRKEQKKQGDQMPQQAAKLTAAPASEPAPANPSIALCATCKTKPRHGKSARCLSCLTRQITDPKHREKRTLVAGERTRAAHAVLKRFEAGELFEAEDRYAEIFGLVPDLEDKLRRRAAANLRSLAAEMAMILREAL